MIVRVEYQGFNRPDQRGLTTLLFQSNENVCVCVCENKEKRRGGQDGQVNNTG